MPEMDIKFRGNYILGTLLVSAGVCVLPLFLVTLAYAVAESWKHGNILPAMGAALTMCVPCLFIIIGLRNRKQAEKEYISAIHQVFVWFIYASMVAALPFAILSAGVMWEFLRSPPNPYKGVVLIGPIAAILVAGFYVLLYIVLGTYYFFMNTFFHKSDRQRDKIVIT